MDFILSGSGWSRGITDASATKYRSLQTTDQSVFTNLVQVAELFNGMVIFHSQTKKVDIITAYPDRGIYIRRGKNLKSVNVTYDSNDLVTRMYVFGGDSDTGSGEISVNSVNLINPGQSYIDNFSYYIINKGFANKADCLAHPVECLRELTWRASEYKDSQALYDDAVEKLNVISQPKLKCVVAGLDLSIFPEYFVSSPILGEAIYVVDDYINLSIQAKVIGITKNHDNPLQLQIEISNEIEYNSILKSLVDSAKKVEKTVNSSGELHGWNISGVIDLYKARLNSTQSNYQGINSDANGNLLIENLDKTKAMRLGGGIFAIAGSKINNEYDWTTFGDGDGFVATQIITGKLRGGKFELDLDNGSMWFGNSTTDYKLKFDGTNLFFGSGVLTWDNVASKPELVKADSKTTLGSNYIYTGTLTAGQINAVQGITLGSNVASVNWGSLPSLPSAANVGALATTWIGTTYIDGNGLYTGTINANKINAGTLTGFTIQTQVSGARLVLNNSNLTSYNSSGYTTLKLTSDDMQWYDNNNGSYCGKIRGLNGYLQIFANSRIDFAAGGSWPLSIVSNGNVIVDGTLLTDKIIGTSFSSQIEFPGGCTFDGSGGQARMKDINGNYFIISGGTPYAVIGGVFKEIALV